MAINGVLLALAALFCDLVGPALMHAPARECSGAPSYSCARTDTNVTPLPSSLPFRAGPTGANSQFVDASFNSQYPVRYTRVTGYYFGGRYGLINGGSFAVGSGSGDDAHFNADESIFTITDQGSNWYFVGLNPRTIQTGLLYATAKASNLIWSLSNRNYAWMASNTWNGLYKMDFTGCHLGGRKCNPKETVLYNFDNCGLPVGTGFNANAGASYDDTVFAEVPIGPGGQDTGHYVVAYNKSTATCFLYDTKAATITEYNSTYPSGHSLGSTTTTDSFTVHGAEIDPSGTWLVVSFNGSCYSGGCWAIRAWKIGTTTVNPCKYNSPTDAGSCQGHSTPTASGWLNGDDYLTTRANPNMQFRTWENMSTTNSSNVTQLSTVNYDFGSLSYDDHPTTKNDPQGTHRYPVFSSVYTSEAKVGAITAAYSNEVIAWTQTPGPPLRFGHTFNSSVAGTALGANNTHFTDLYALGAVSPLGDFYLYTTDGEGTLGNINGTTTCSVNGGTCRSDVFLMALTPVP